MKITLLKLGGSLITDKSVAYHAKLDRIDNISSQIAQALRENPELYLILGNGAGSFAHQSAAKYGTMGGFSDDEGRYGACVVHHDAMRLNQIVMNSLLKEKIPAFSMQPSAMMKNEVPKPNAQFQLLENLLAKKMIPVVYGDVIIDPISGATIYSTDTIFKILSENLVKKNHTLTIIHLGSYEGVRGESNELISKITPQSYNEIVPFLQKSQTTDVTGGMKLKVDEMLELAKLGVTPHLLDGTKDNAVYKALQGSFSGTTIAAE